MSDRTYFYIAKENLLITKNIYDTFDDDLEL